MSAELDSDAHTARNARMKPTLRLYVGNLPSVVTEEDLLRRFQGCGFPLDCDPHIIINRKHGETFSQLGCRIPSFAFITVSAQSLDSLEKQVKKFQSAVWQGFRPVVQVARPDYDAVMAGQWTLMRRHAVREQALRSEAILQEKERVRRLVQRAIEARRRAGWARKATRVTGGVGLTTDEIQRRIDELKGRNDVPDEMQIAMRRLMGLD